MSTLQSKSFWTVWKLQRDSYMWHHIALLKKQNKTHWLTFIIQTGSRSSHKDIISGKKLSLYQTFHLSAMTPVFSTCFKDISLSRVSGYLYHPTVTIHASSPLCDEDGYQIPSAVWNVSCFFCPPMSATFSLWWCLVGGVQGGTISVLCSWSSTNHRSGLS